MQGGISRLRKLQHWTVYTGAGQEAGSIVSQPVVLTVCWQEKLNQHLLPFLFSLENSLVFSRPLIFSKCAELCHHHHYPVWISITPEDPWGASAVNPLPRPAPGSLVSTVCLVSTDSSFLEGSCKWNHTTWSHTSGFFHVAQCFCGSPTVSVSKSCSLSLWSQIPD